MIIDNKKRPSKVYGTEIPNGTYFEDRIGFWATVKEVNSQTNTVTVLSDTGFKYTDISVISDEWVSNNDNYVSGSRNLPPENSRVFVLTPTKTIQGSFVLCSGFARGETGTHTLYADETNKTDLNTVKEKNTCGGWTEKEDYKTGNRLIESKDKNISIQMNVKANAEKEETKGIIINAWNYEIKITDEGMTIKPAGALTIDANNSAIEIKNANTFKVNNHLEVTL